MLRAQNPTDSLPPDPGAFTFTVSKMQDMNFGAFSVGAGGGSITITPTGTRTAGGAVVLLNMGFPYTPAIFSIDAPQGTIISVTNGPNVALAGSNGGSATLQLGVTNPASPFVTNAQSPATTQVGLGGTLTLSGLPPPGTYTGTFEITFNYQ